MSKILIVGPAYPLRGGLATYNERLAQEFQSMGHQCHILSFSLQYPSLLFPGKTQYATEEAAPEAISIYAEINSINPLNWIKVGRRVKNDSYDLVIFRYWMSFMAPAFGTIASIIKKNKHTRVLAICDNLIPHEQRFFDKPFTNYFISKCDGFLSMSHAVKQQLHKWPVNKPVAYSPHPMYDMFGPEISKNAAKQKLGLDDNSHYLLFFGFIRKYKGLHLLLDAFADARLRHLNLKLIVAGEFYEDAKPYLEQIDKLGLTDTVILSNDFIPNTSVSAYFCAADVVVQPYLNATQSGVTQIAYYYDKPMIVTNVGGLAELVPDGSAGLVVETTKEAVANAIFDFYNQQLENQMKLAVREEKQKFTWSYLCNQLLNL